VGEGREEGDRSSVERRLWRAKGGNRGVGCGVWGVGCGVWGVGGGGWRVEGGGWTAAQVGGGRGRQEDAGAHRVRVDDATYQLTTQLTS
jgi:hypothetical protein